jgi:hypothetical protein
VDSASDFLITVGIRGETLRLRVDPGAPAYVLLNGSVAHRLGLKRSAGTTFIVGPVSLDGDTSFEQLAFGGERVTRPVMWFNADLVTGADGEINPAHLPWSKVRIRLHPPQGGERLIVIPTEFDRERGLFYPFEYSGETLLTRFSLADRLTSATGASAALIAGRRGGRWSGDVAMEPVRYTIRRPVRELVLGQPLSVNGFLIERLMVRVRDDLGEYRLPSDAVAQGLPVENAIVVTGKRRQAPSGIANFWLMIGRDDLSRCSDIVYDRNAQELLLHCLGADKTG